MDIHKDCYSAIDLPDKTVPTGGRQCNKRHCKFKKLNLSVEHRGSIDLPINLFKQTSMNRAFDASSQCFDACQRYGALVGLGHESLGLFPTIILSYS
jgi:hypothetical protein